MRKTLRFLFLFLALFIGLQLSAQNDYEYYDRIPTYDEVEQVWEYDPDSRPAWITTVDANEWTIPEGGQVASNNDGQFRFGSDDWGDGSANNGKIKGTVTSPNFSTDTPLTLLLDFTQANHAEWKNHVIIDFHVTYKDTEGEDKEADISIDLSVENHTWVITPSGLASGEHENNVYTFLVPLPSDYGSDGHTQMSITAGGALIVGAGTQGGGGNTIDVYGDNLVLRDDWDNTERLKRNAGTKMKKVTIVRSYDKGWYTLSLPFNLTMKQFQRRFMAGFDKATAEAGNCTWKEATSAEIWAYDSFSNNVMQFRKQYGEGEDATVLNAVVPYLIYVPQSIENTLVDFTAPAYIGEGSDDVQPGEKVMVFTNITLADEGTLFGTANVVEQETGYKFVSNLSKTDLASVMAENQIYYLHTDGEGENPKLYKPSSASTNIKGFRAYFTSPMESTTTNPSALSFDDSLSSIDTVELPSIADGLIFNLQGQLVNKTLQVLPRGIYIVNHKKYVVK